MARSDTRYSIYPAPKAIEILGNTSPALNLAIECWAALITRAIAENSKTFTEWFADEGGDQPLHEWRLIAEALKDLRVDPEFARPGYLLTAAVEDTATLAEDAEWLRVYCDDWTDKTAEKLKQYLDGAMSSLVKKLHTLDYTHAWALIIAVQWFWNHKDEGIDTLKDQWWTLAFRRQWKERHSGKKEAAALNAPNKTKPSAKKEAEPAAQDGKKAKRTKASPSP